MKVELLPEPGGVVGIIKQIKSGTRAYPFFGTARLFLEKPERHRVRISSLDANVPLFQVGDGAVGFDRVALERQAFEQMLSEYYSENVVEGEPLKGIFKSVARCRSTGTILGPTSYHGYQPALRKLYEERFSRRMSFREFQSEEIEMLTDEQSVEQWKNQARLSTSFITTQEAEALTFKTRAEVEEHFRKTYLPQLVKTGITLELGGASARACSDRGIGIALREAWERERSFPACILYHLRPRFMEAGLHLFKHRKRVFFVSPIRPQRHSVGHALSDGVASILSTLEKHPKINRPQLASHILGEALPADAPETVTRKAALASDLHYLIHAGHVIEFHDGTLDLPLSPKADEDKDISSTDVLDDASLVEPHSEVGSAESSNPDPVAVVAGDMTDTGAHGQSPSDSVQTEYTGQSENAVLADSECAQSEGSTEPPSTDPV